MTIQFKKGVLELCVLSMLKQDDQYGYDVASKLSKSIDIADGSIYLVLRRLKQDDYVSSYLEEASGGPPRKYYVITRKGERFLDQLIAEWAVLVDNVNNIIYGGADIGSQLESIAESVPVGIPAGTDGTEDTDEIDGGQTDE